MPFSILQQFLHKYRVHTNKVILSPSFGNIYWLLQRSSLSKNREKVTMGALSKLLHLQNSYTLGTQKIVRDSRKNVRSREPGHLHTMSVF